MSQFQLKKSNHFVSKFYLRNWVVDDEKVWRYLMLVSHPKVPIWSQVTLDAAASRKGLYNIRTRQSLSDELERWFDTRFENKASYCIRKAIREESLSSKDWEVLIEFFGMQDVRTLKKLFEHIKLVEEQVPKILKETEKDLSETSITQLVSSQKEKYTPKNSSHFPIKTSVSVDEKCGDLKFKVEFAPGRETWHNGIRNILNNSLHHLL